jgi:cell division protein CrgA
LRCWPMGLELHPEATRRPRAGTQPARIQIAERPFGPFGAPARAGTILRIMPKSRQRQKPRASRYQLEPQKRQKAKASPRWYGPLVLTVMAIGVGVIVWNYMRGDQTSNAMLWAGLGLIGVGFFGTMFWR